MKDVLKLILGIVVLFLLLGFAGRSDWSDEVVYNMPNHIYSSITTKLGYGCSNYDIAREYTDNKEYYDSLSDF